MISRSLSPSLMPSHIGVRMPRQGKRDAIGPSERIGDSLPRHANGNEMDMSFMEIISIS
jgi:hypothetical protein